MGVFDQLADPLHGELVQKRDRVAFALGPQVGVDGLEQVAGARIPAPPEVARKLFERAQPRGKALFDHHAVPVGPLGNKLLPHEVDLLVVGASAVEHRPVGSGYGVLNGVGVGLFVSPEKVLPQRREGYFIGRAAHFGDLLSLQQGEAQQCGGDLRGGLAAVVVVAANHLHARTGSELVHPQPESRERRGDGRHRKSHRFQRRISPRFVVGGENRHVHARQQLVIGLVEDAVRTVQVGRNEDHAHLRSRLVEHAPSDRTHDGIAARVFEVVGHIGELRRIDRPRRVLQMGLQIGAGAVVGRRHGDKGQHIASEPVRRRERLERIQKDVEPLVVKLVTAAGSHDQGLLRVLLPQTGLRHGDHRTAGVGATPVELRTRPHEAVVEAVGGHTVHLPAQQEFALVGRDVAHRQERIVVGGRHLLDRMFGHHIVAAGQVVGVQTRQIVVKRQAVSGDAAAHHGGMGGEHGGDVGGISAQVQSARRGHPFVEVGGHFVRRGAEILHIGGDHHACSIAEQHRLDVVPLPGDRIDAVVLPQSFEDFVLARKERGEVHQHHQRRTLDFPVADPYADALFIEALTPHAQQAGVLLEFGIHPFVREVGPDEHVTLPQSPGYGRCLRGNDGMDAADLIADLPTHLE